MKTVAQRLDNLIFGSIDMIHMNLWKRQVKMDKNKFKISSLKGKRRSVMRNINRLQEEYEELGNELKILME